MSYFEKIYKMLNKIILGLSSRWHYLMFSASLLAGPVFVTLCISLFGIIGLIGKKQLILKLALLIVVTHALVVILKHVFRKPRPDTEYARNIKFSKYSFPSGHAAVGSVLWYGMVLVLSNLGISGGVVLVMTFLSPIIVILIGVSRVYLGAHYLIDVFVGWVIGFVMMISFAIFML